MSKRKILYGYQIENGEFVIHIQEAEIVKRVYQIYQSGESYQRICDMLNAENIPFSEDSPLWDKHKVKRLLENPRYTGANGYPEIIEHKDFDFIQQMIAGKTKGYIRKTVSREKILLDKLRCAECGKKLVRVRNQTPDGMQHLKCQGCETRLTVMNALLLQEIFMQVEAHHQGIVQEYQPSDDVFRLENVIRRGLENPEHPQDIADLILKAAAARYDCCKQGMKNKQNEISIENFQREIAHITVSPEEEMKVYFNS